MLSTARRDNILNWYRGTAYPATPSSILVSLHTSDPGLTGAAEIGSGLGYSRQGVTFGAPFDESGFRRIANLAIVTFGPASGAGFDLVTHGGIWVVVGGVTSFDRGFDCTDQLVLSGNSARFPIGALKLGQA